MAATPRILSSDDYIGSGVVYLLCSTTNSRLVSDALIEHGFTAQPAPPNVGYGSKYQWSLFIPNSQKTAGDVVAFLVSRFPGDGFVILDPMMPAAINDAMMRGIELGLVSDDNMDAMISAVKNVMGAGEGLSNAVGGIASGIGGVGDFVGFATRNILLIAAVVALAAAGLWLYSRKA